MRTSKRRQSGGLECAPWITVINRDQKVEALPWADEASARNYFDLAQIQWSESWLCRVVIGPRDMKGMTYPAPRTDKPVPSFGDIVSVRGTFVGVAKQDSGRICVRFAPDEEAQWMPSALQAPCLRRRWRAKQTRFRVDRAGSLPR